MAISKKFALGAIVGVAAGVIAGMLTAPKAGRETRSDIRRKAADMKAGASDTIDHVVDKAEEYMHRAEDAVRDVKRDVAGSDKDKEEGKKGFWEK